MVHNNLRTHEGCYNSASLFCYDVTLEQNYMLLLLNAV